MLARSTPQAPFSGLLDDATCGAGASVVSTLAADWSAGLLQPARAMQNAADSTMCFTKSPSKSDESISFNSQPAAPELYRTAVPRRLHDSLPRSGPGA